MWKPCANADRIRWWTLSRSHFLARAINLDRRRSYALDYRDDLTSNRPTISGVDAALSITGTKSDDSCRLFVPGLKFSSFAFMHDSETCSIRSTPTSYDVKTNENAIISAVNEPKRCNRKPIPGRERKRMIVKILKKGNPLECDSLFLAVVKILFIIILDCIKDHL